MAIDMYAGISVSDYARALPWYERLFGREPTFVATATIEFGGAPLAG